MGGFFMCRSDSESGGEHRINLALQQFAAHGFGTPRRFETATHHGFHVDHIHGGPAAFYSLGGDFIAVAGTLVYEDSMGKAALRKLLSTFTLPFDEWKKVKGHFALLVHKAGRTAVLTDYFGAFQVFHDASFGIISTSFLAAAKSLDRLRFDPQGVYEFAFNVLPTGDDTVFEDVRRLGPDAQIEVGAGVVRHAVNKPIPDTISQMPLDQRLALHTESLRSVVAPFVAEYGQKMQCPLSGGLDSRLALAVLRSHGVQPHVYVYGRPGDDDVEIAKRIGAAENFEVEVFDKAAWRRIGPDEFATVVERNFHEMDALGGLFDNGGSGFARHARQSGGQLAVSGGCGEVFRNFFYLPNRPMYAREVVQAFFARFDTAYTTTSFVPSQFIGELERKALTALGHSDGARRLSRQAVEQLYPRMRCRAFFGREISIVGRYGCYLMPFFERGVVAEAAQLPLSMKTAGRFEAQLLAHIDPSLAKHDSAYGHSFLEPPGRTHLVSEWATILRPIPLRRLSYTIQQFMKPRSVEHGGFLAPAFLQRVLDLHFRHMRRFFKVDCVSDSELYGRIATLEYLAQHVQDRLVDT